MQHDKISNGVWLTRYQKDGKYVQTRAYTVWRGMLERCKNHAHLPTYVGCSVGGGFDSFQNFAAWYVIQPGYTEHYALDKDILVPGNRVYSPATCALIPAQLNNFLTSRGASRGLYPLGVHYHKGDKRFHARLSIDGKVRFVSSHDCPNEAHEAYKKAKQQEAIRWAGRLDAGEFTVCQRVASALRSNYAVFQA